MLKPSRGAWRRISIATGLAGLLLAGCEGLEDLDGTAAAPAAATTTAAEAAAPAASPSGRPLADQFFAATAGFCAELMVNAQNMQDAISIGDRTGFVGGLEDQSKAPMREVEAVAMDLQGQKMFWTSNEGKAGTIQTFVLLPSPVNRCRVALLDSPDAAQDALDKLRDEDSGWVAEANPPAPVDGIQSYMFYKQFAAGPVGLNLAVPVQQKPEYGRLVAMATVFRPRPEAVPTQ